MLKRLAAIHEKNVEQLEADATNAWNAAFPEINFPTKTKGRERSDAHVMSIGDDFFDYARHYVVGSRATEFSARQ